MCGFCGVFVGPASRIGSLSRGLPGVYRLSIDHSITATTVVPAATGDV